MIQYFKTLSDGNTIGLGYMDTENPNNMLFHTFKEDENSYTEQIDVNEFMQLAMEHDFEGLKAPDSVLPGAYFPEYLN